MNNEVIEFGMRLTGHDRKTIEQMYNDWKQSVNKKVFKFDCLFQDSCSSFKKEKCNEFCRLYI